MAFDTLASQESIDNVVAALRERNIAVDVVENKDAALAAVKNLLPDGADVMTGSSVTLEQIGLVELLQSSNHPWNNRKDAIMAEKDTAKQAVLRKQATLAEYFLGSVHAITEQGQLLIASASGSQIPSFAYSSNHVIWVAGTQKIVPDVKQGLIRIREHVFPREDQHMKDLGFPGSSINKILIVEREGTFLGRTLRLILVKEKLGF